MNDLESFKKQSFKLPDWQQAEKHARATVVGKPLSNNHSINESDKCCQCCGHIIQKEPVSLCSNTKQLEFIGIGFPLYFIFFKYCIVLMLIQTISTSIASLSNALDDNFDFCMNNVPKLVPNLNEEVQCTSYFVYLANIEQNISKQVVILRLVYFLITILFFVYMRDSLRKLIGYYDQRCTTFSDYSFILKKLPHKNKVKENIYNLLSQFQIHSIIVIGTFDHIQKMKHQIQRKHEEKKKVEIRIEESGSNIKECEKLMKELEAIQRKVQKLQIVFMEMVANEHKLYSKDEIIPQKVIISVETDEEKEEIIEKFKSGEGLILPKEWSLEQFKKIEVAQSPQPREIIWQNLNAPLNLKVRNYILGWTITFTILALISTIFYFLLVQLSSMIEHEVEGNLNLAKASFYILLVFIIIVNKFIISPILHEICHFEKYFTKTKEQYGFTVKYLLSMFFTTAMMTVLVEAITKKNIYAHYFGVVESQSVMIIFTSLLIPIIWFINPWTIVIKLKQYYNRTNRHLTQTEANGIMEPMEYQMGKRYAEVVKLVWLVFLYRSLIPIGPALATIGLAVYYWVDKYNLLRRSSVKEAVSGFLTLRVMTLLEFSIVLKCGGELFFDLQIRYEYSKVSVVCLIVGLIYMFLPKNKLLEYIHDQKFNNEEKKLSQCVKDLGPSYQQLHPILGKSMMNLLDSLSNYKNTQTDRVYDSTIFQLNKPILSHVCKMQTQRINTTLKNWKKEFLSHRHYAKQSLLQSNNNQGYDL